MSRPPPRISAAQLKNLADISRAQAIDAATSSGREEMSRELELSFEKSRKELDKNAKALEKHYAWTNRYGHWLARVALLPILILAVGMFFVVTVGIWTGEIKELQKYSKLVVTRTASPLSYWLSVAYHSAMAAFIAWVGTVILRAAKIGRRSSS